MRLFVLDRKGDPTGVSGTGIVAVGYVLDDDDTVVLRWREPDPSVVIRQGGIDAVRRVHGHDGNTEVVWLEDLPIPTEDLLGLKAVVNGS